MKIISVDPFYLKMPVITDAADGTQDTVLIRVRTDEGIDGWGECDASPLVSMACYCCPMSHGNIINVRESLVGETLDAPDDVRRLHAKVMRNGMDIQQIHHAYSGADIALWDIVGKKLGQPIYRLLDPDASGQHPKIPYASVLFGDTSEQTYERARGLREQGYQAAKFGWGPMGQFGEENDVALVRAAREGMGEAQVMIDAGVAWKEDADTAFARAVAFAPFQPTWLEEPLFAEAIEAYAALTSRQPPVPIAGGEGCSTFRAAEDFIRHSGVQFVQIDVGRVGGITVAHRVRQLAERHGMQYVNHTFKSHFSVAASLHVFATVEEFDLLEYPAAGSDLSRALTTESIAAGNGGRVQLPQRPGLGVAVNWDTLRKYLQPVRIFIGDDVVFEQEGRM